jgi:hypothetical protein
MENIQENSIIKMTNISAFIGKQTLLDIEIYENRV